MTDPNNTLGGVQLERNSLWEKLRSFFRRTPLSPGQERLSRLTPQLRAQLLYEYCIASEKKVSETVHNLYIIAEHYSADNPNDLEKPEAINLIPTFFATLTATEKADYCYNQVTEALSIESMPVTVESLRATKRRAPDDPWSSYAGQFVWDVTLYVVLSLAAMGIAYVVYFQFLKSLEFIDGSQARAIEWIAFGCIGALIHLLNHALTTTRLQTFEVSEARKIWPRLLLGGMFGYVLPWMLGEATDIDVKTASGPIAAFFGGYSVRFSVGLVERIMEAVLPETKHRA